MSRASRLALTVVALTALVEVVAVASRAHHPGGGNGAAPAHPPVLLAEYAVSVMIVLFPLGAILVIWAYSMHRREALLRGGTTWRQFLGLLALTMIMLPVALFGGKHFLHRGSNTPAASGKATKPAKKGKSSSKRSPTPAFHFQFLPALVVGSLVLGFGVVAGWAVLKRRMEGDEWDREAALKAALDEVLADTLDDLRAERDPRRAVIRTYARMEETFAAYGVPREEAEAPLEYVERVLDRLNVSSFSTGRMTQ